jgi:putative transposase
MRKANKFRLYPTKQQEKTLFWTLTRCRELYNAALAERKEAYRMAGKSITYYEQKRDLPEIKAELREEYQQIHSQVLQDDLLRLKRAFDAFFRRVENGEEPGYPRFQGRNRYNSFTYPQGGYSLTHDSRLCLSKIGSIKITLHRPLEGTIKTCTVKYEAGQWYAVFSCEVAQPEPLPPVESEVGIDLGVSHFAALSDGTFIENPRHYRRAQKKLENLQQALSRKKRGSHRREKARKAVAKTHRKIANQRRGGKVRTQQEHPGCRMGTIPTDRDAQGSMRRSHGPESEPPLYLPGVLAMRHRAQKRPLREMAFLRVWSRTR